MPRPRINPSWTQAGGQPSHVMQHLSLSDDPQRIWSANIGSGSGQLVRLLAPPVVGDGVVFTDPRSVRAGARILWSLKNTMAALESDQFLSVYAHDYDEYRLSLGLPDGSRDFEVDRTIALEANFEALNGIDFQKGCFVGQEVTARTKYRGLVKKRLVPVSIDGSLPAPDTPILLGDKEVGRMRSGADGLGIAMLRLEAIDPTSGPLHAGDARIVPAIDDRT